MYSWKKTWKIEREGIAYLHLPVGRSAEMTAGRTVLLQGAAKRVRRCLDLVNLKLFFFFS
jgi:hypothetical protein